MRISLSPSAIDPDEDTVLFTYDEPFDLQGVWTTSEGDAGKYRITITASDGKLEDEIQFYVIVESLNKKPVIEVEESVIEVEEGEYVIIDADITDPEEDELIITYSGWMTSDTYKTTFDDQGTHKITITVSDGIHTVTETVRVIVSDQNRPPVFDPGAFI